LGEEERGKNRQIGSGWEGFYVLGELLLTQEPQEWQEDSNWPPLQTKSSPEALGGASVVESLSEGQMRGGNWRPKDRWAIKKSKAGGGKNQRAAETRLIMKWEAAKARDPPEP